MTDKTYTPAEIADALGGTEHTAGSLASTVAAFWPTIKAALLHYDGATNSRRVKPIKQDW